MSAITNIHLVALTNRQGLLNAVRQALTDTGSDAVKNFFETADEMTNYLRQNSSIVTFVVLDWDLGPDSMSRYFVAVNEIAERDMWTAVIFSTEPSNELVACAAENNIQQVHTGQLTPEKFKGVVEELNRQRIENIPLREGITTARKYADAQDWAAVDTHLKALNEKYPGNSLIAVEAAQSLVAQKNPDGALKLLQKHLESDKLDPRILHMAAKANLAKGDKTTAVKFLARADVLSPLNIERLIELGHALLSLNKVSAAEDAFDRAHTIDGENIEGIKGLGTCKLLDGEINEALKLMTGVISGNELASVFNSAAVLSMHQNEFDKGMKLYDAAEKALARKQKLLARIAYNRGIGCYRFHKLEEARACFEKALSLDPGFTNAQFNLKALVEKSAKGVSQETMDVLADEDERI